MGAKGPKMNEKAVAARERKAAVADAAAAAKAQAAEDAKWADEGSTRKEQRNAAKAAKAQEQMEAKARKKEINNQEDVMMASVRVTGAAKQNLRAHGLAPAQKVTQYELQQRKEAEEAQRKKAEAERTLEQQKILAQDPLMHENTNKIRRDQEAEDKANNIIKASGTKAIVQALSAANITAADIKQDPGKRRKRLYKKYETRRMNEIKDENPELKISQIKDKIFKEFQRLTEEQLDKLEYD